MRRKQVEMFWGAKFSGVQDDVNKFLKMFDEEEIKDVDIKFIPFIVPDGWTHLLAIITYIDEV